MDVRFCSEQEPTAERQRAQRQLLIELATRSPEREKKTRVFQLTKTYMDAGDTGVLSLKVDAVADYRIVAADRGGYGEGQDGGLHALIRV